MVLLTHFDLDGIGCALLVKLQTPQKAVEFHGHDTIEAAVLGYLEQGEHVLCTDIAPKRETLLGLTMEQRSRLSIIDHHAKGPLGGGDIEGLRMAVYDPNYCATELVFDTMVCKDLLDEQYRRDLERLVATIRTRDLWERESPLWSASEGLQTLMKFMGLKALLGRLLNDPSPHLTPQEQGVVSILQEKERSYIEGRVEAHKHEIDPEGRVFVWTYATRCFSEVCHGMLKVCPKAEYAAAYDANTGRMELRSREGGTHVGEIAASRGGGGHPCASGYSVPVPGFPTT